MSITTFFLSYPRSRTSWLATYLTGMGVYSFHELWRDVDNIKDFKEAMLAQGPGPVTNVDASNWFFLTELREAFPDAQYIEIVRPASAVSVDLLGAYGTDGATLLDAYEAVADELPPVVHRLEFDDWDEAESRLIMHMVAPDLPFNEGWHRRIHQLDIQVTTARIEEDFEMARRGALDHIVRRTSWVQ